LDALRLKPVPRRSCSLWYEQQRDGLVFGHSWGRQPPQVSLYLGKSHGTGLSRQDLRQNCCCRTKCLLTWYPNRFIRHLAGSEKEAERVRTFGTAQSPQSIACGPRSERHADRARCNCGQRQWQSAIGFAHRHSDGFFPRGGQGSQLSLRRKLFNFRNYQYRPACHV